MRIMYSTGYCLLYCYSLFKQEYLSHETRAELHQSSWKIFEKFLWSMVKSQWYS